MGMREWHGGRGVWLFDEAMNLMVLLVVRFAWSLYPSDAVF